VDETHVSLAAAVIILNAKRHHGSGEWQVWRGVVTCGDYCDLSEFEAIAVAEKYQREDEEQ
jgi:hypothetical protein